MELKYLTIIIPSLTFLISLIFFYLTYRQTKKHNNLPVLIEYIGEWRKENGIKESYYFLLNNFTEEDIQNNENYTLNNIPDVEKRKHAKNVAHYFDNLGLLVFSKALEEKYVISFIGANAHTSWEILKNFIIVQRIRNRKNPLGIKHYQRKFEYFAKLYEENIDRINKELDILVKKKNLDRTSID